MSNYGTGAREGIPRRKGRAARMREGIALTVTESEGGTRLDRFLRGRLPGIPSRSVRFAIEAGEVRVDGEKGRKGRHLSAGEEVIVRKIAEAKDWLPEPCELPGAAVLFADDVVAVLEKPVDVHTEPHRPGEKGTLAGYLLGKFPFVAEFSVSAGLTLLTRLDYATSGAIPAALTPEALDFLSREREKGEILKTYYCLVSGHLDKELTLSFRIDTGGGKTVRVKTGARDPDPMLWTTVTPVRAKDSVTLVRAEISRGKRHQIRAHLAAAGFPVVGDRRYSTVPPEGPGHGRLMLHAAQVAFLHPVRKERMTVVSPIPEEFGSI
jgi:23S rRNA-/tRNA-specific pseudouridylate synthase